MSCTRLNPADSGWQELTLSSNALAYETSSKPMYRKCGNTVQVVGAVKPKTEVASGSDMEIGVLPSGFRPAQRVTAICQGSDRNTWLLSVYPAGGIFMERYRSGTTAIAASTTSWLAFSATFITA